MDKDSFKIEEDLQFNVDLKTQLTIRELLDEANKQKFYENIKGYYSLVHSAFIELSGYLKEEEIKELKTLFSNIAQPVTIREKDGYGFSKFWGNYDWRETEEGVDEINLKIRSFMEKKGVSYRKKERGGLIRG